MATLNKSDVFASLPKPPEGSLRSQIREALGCSRAKLVVLDDDPTGTQTVYDVPVLTEWSVAALRREFENDLDCFYILTNSRSLARDDAAAMNREIAQHLQEAAEGRPFHVVSRSDSTLRGHFPLETDVLNEVLGPYDGILLVPYFEAGGRYTIGDVHYVAEGEQLVPAGETPFALDATFGYRHSNLKSWVEEKTGATISASEVHSISIECIRREGLDGIEARLKELQGGAVCIINAAAPSDLDLVMLALGRVEAAGKRFLFRTGAQFVSARLGLEDRPLWRPERAESALGGLVVVGSHVPKSTQQLEHLLADGNLEAEILDVKELLDAGESLIAAKVTKVSELISSGRDVVVYTSRELVLGADPEASLAVSRQVSEALVSIVQRLTVSPGFLIAKGGITSSDVATRGLGIKRARVLGALLPGVPVWETAGETRFPEIPYVVFPGNVGGTESLLDAVRLFQDCRA